VLGERRLQNRILVTTMHRLPPRPPALALLALTALAPLSCSGRAGGDQSADRTVRARLVTLETRQQRRDVESVGSLFANEEVVVSSEVEGRVERVLCEVGDSVARGQPLVQVAPRELELGLEQQRGALEQVRAQLGLGDGSEDLGDPNQAAEVRRAAAQLQDAQQKYERARSLFEEGLVARGDYDEASSRFEAARAAHEMALQEVENLRAELRQRRAGVALAEKKLGDTLIRAPFAGQVSRRSVAPGQYLRLQTPVVSIVSIDPLRVRLQVPEKVAGWIEVGQPVEVAVEAYPDQRFSGEVARISPAVDRETRSLEVEALLANPDGRLKPGFFAKATIASKRVEQVLLVPNEAVRYVFGVYKVFAVQDRTLDEREVTLGERTGDQVEVVEGLKPDERIAIPLQGEVAQTGDRVEIVD